MKNIEEIDFGRRWRNVFGDWVEEKIKGSGCTLCSGEYDESKEIMFVVLDSGEILWWHKRLVVGTSDCTKIIKPI